MKLPAPQTNNADPALKDKILQATIAAREDQLAALLLRLKEEDKHLQEIIKERDATTEARHKELKQHHKKMEKLKKNYLDFQEGIQKLKSDKKVIQSEIYHRNRYRIEQEKLINTAIEEGNLKLKGYVYQIRDVEEKRAALEKSLLDLNREKNSIIDDIAKLHDSYPEIEKALREEADQERMKLKLLQGKVLSEQQKLKTISGEIDAKLQILETREKGLLAKEAAIRHEQTELDTARRRFESAQHFYDIGT